MFGIGIEVLIILILIAVNGLLAMSELAVVSAQRARLQRRAEEGDTGAQTALALADEPTRFLSTVQIGITLVGILAGAFGGASIASRLSDWFVDAGISGGVADTLSVVLVVLVITYLTLTFGELVPKRLALNHPEAIASHVAGPMEVLARAASPLVTLLTVSTRAVLSILGLREQREERITEEEIRTMIGMSAEAGSVDIEEAELLERVFHFGDRRVHEVMIPRTEVVWLPLDARIADFYKVFARAPHSRFPVFDQNTDDVAGIVGIKDVLAAAARGELTSDSPIEPLMRPAYFVPEAKLIGSLFREMQARGIQMAVAVDEFGGTAGIVTLEQLLEEMVGQMRDELAAEEMEVRTIDERTSEVDGALSVEEARDDIGLDIPDGPYDTVAGWVLDQLGHIPREGETFTFDGSRITVTEMQGLKVERVRVVKS